KTIELVDHRVESFFQLQNLTAYVHGNLARKVAAGDCRSDLSDVAALPGQVAGHEVHVVGQVLPRSTDTRNLRLAPQFSFRAHFARHTRHFAREGVQLIHHGVDGVFQFENLALHIDGDLARQIASRHGRRDFGDVAYLRCEVAGHCVDRVREVFPRAGDAGDNRLPAKFAVGADFARHARYFGSERPQLVHHRIDGFLELQNLSAHVHSDLARKIAAGHGSGYFGNVTDLTSQVAGPGVDGVREIFPRARHARHLSLPSQFSIRSNLASDASYFGSEYAQLLNHGVDD